MMNKSFVTDTVFKAKLTLRLIQDGRVGIWLKLIPLSCLLYLIAPIDLIVGPIDDAILLYLGMEVFIEFCPQELVSEHTQALRGQSAPAPEPEGEVVDAEFKDQE